MGLWFLAQLTTHTAKMKNPSENNMEGKQELTEKELDVITTVFRSYETGLREATILPKVRLYALMTNVNSDNKIRGQIRYLN